VTATRIAGFRAAFYKGTRPGLPGIYNRGVRHWTHSKYSHVELIFSDGVSWSSSFEDGGVRSKEINYSSDDWDFIELPPWMEDGARRWFEQHKGWHYDLAGNVHFVFFFVRGAQRKVFCSEAIAEALGLREGYRFDPGTLHVVLSSPLLMMRPATFINIEFSQP
jgi:hypothetical protein